MEEIWKDLPMQGVHSRYQISNMGNIRKVHVINGVDVRMRPLKTHIRKDGDGVAISLRSNGKSSTYYISRLVAQHFVDNPNNYKNVKHKDGNIYNNVASNLMWYDNNTTTYDITFYGQSGKYKMEQCKKFPTKKLINETLKELHWWVGDVDKIVIDNIKRIEI